jgi:hypothetical protein
MKMSNSCRDVVSKEGLPTTAIKSWLPLLEELRVWFADELPRVATTISIPILYEHLHLASPWPRLIPPPEYGGKRMPLIAKMRPRTQRRRN